VTTVAVVFHSVTGTTKTLARAIADGVKSEQASALELEIVGTDVVYGRYENHRLLTQIEAANALIMGSPTFMGSVTAQFKAFADASSEQWTELRWADKLAAGFTIGSNYSGDQLSTIQYLGVLAAQHGMLWVGLDLAGGYEGDTPNRLGAQSGLIAYTRDDVVDPRDLQTAHYLGARVARLANRFHSG